MLVTSAIGGVGKPQFGKTKNLTLKPILRILIFRAKVDMILSSVIKPVKIWIQRFSVLEKQEKRCLISNPVYGPPTKKSCSAQMKSTTKYTPQAVRSETYQGGKVR